MLGGNIIHLISHSINHCISGRRR